MIWIELSKVRLVTYCLLTYFVNLLVLVSEPEINNCNRWVWNSVKNSLCSCRDNEVLFRSLHGRRVLTASAKCQRWSDSSRSSADLGRKLSTDTSLERCRRYHAKRWVDWADRVSDRRPLKTHRANHAGTTQVDRDDALRPTYRPRQSTSRWRSPSYLQHQHSTPSCKIR